MFQLSVEEMQYWISQFAISNKLKMGLRKAPFAFTENGVAMLSSVLSSPRAIHVNIQIMQIFTTLREAAGLHAEVLRRLNKHEVQLLKHDRRLDDIFKAIEDLARPSSAPEKKKNDFFPREKIRTEKRMLCFRGGITGCFLRTLR